MRERFDGEMLSLSRSSVNVISPLMVRSGGTQRGRLGEGGVGGSTEEEKRRGDPLRSAERLAGTCK